jgi:hypothetical protein
MGMLKYYAKTQLDKFEREWGYDVTYMREVLDEAGFGAIVPMMGMSKISNYRHDIPAAPYFAAAIAATRAGDCGPCVQLGVRMAERAGVPPTIIRAALSNDRAAMPEDVRLCYDLAQSTIARNPAEGDAIRAEILRRWGRRALVSLAYGIAAGGFYPAFKYALGHGHACQRVSVDGLELAVPELV